MGSAITMTVDAASETVSLSPETIALHERVTVRVVNVVAGDVSSLDLVILFRNAVVARCDDFTEDDNDFVGTLDLGTDALKALFAGKRSRETLLFDLALYDSYLDTLLVNAQISIMNNPYTPGMALPTEEG